MPISAASSEQEVEQVSRASFGYSSAAESGGNYATAATSGNASQFCSSGYYSRAAASGSNNIAEAMGNCSAAAAAGNNCVSEAMGSYSKSAVSWHDGKQIRITVGAVGENGVKPDTWYRVNGQGQWVEATDYTLDVMYVPASANVYDC